MYREQFYKLTKNAAKCLVCSDVIESKSRHDYRSCTCGAISVDGGLEYSRRTYNNVLDIWDLSETRKFTIGELKDAFDHYADSCGNATYEDWNTEHMELARSAAKEWYGVDL